MMNLMTTPTWEKSVSELLSFVQGRVDLCMTSVHLRLEFLSVSPACDPALPTSLESELSLLMKFE